MTTVYRSPIFAVTERKVGPIKRFATVHHPGAVCVVAYDEECVYLVRQDRPAVQEQRMLELPAGTVEPGESVILTAQRELREECLLGAEIWTPMTTFYSSPGYCDEEVYLIFATNLYHDETGTRDEGEEIEVVAWPLTALDEAIEQTMSAKCKVGLMALKFHLDG